MSSKYNNTFIITQGSKQTLIPRSGHFETHNPAKVTTVNTTGCGDSFLAGLVWGFYQQILYQKRWRWEMTVQ